MRPETKQARDDWQDYKRRVAESEAAPRARGAADPDLEPDLTPSNPRLQPFYDRAVREQSRYVCGELSREQFATNLYAIAAKLGVSQLVPWADDFGLPGPTTETGAAEAGGSVHGGTA